MRIPSLAIHFDRQENFQFNKQEQLFPIAGLVAAELKRQDASKPDDKHTETNGASSIEEFSPLKAATQRHHPHIVELIAKDAGVSSEDVIDFEVILFDTHSACFGGINDELILSARLDNLNSTYCATEAIIDSLSDPSSLDSDTTVRLIASFDNEEIGSTTTQGANSHILPAILRRISVLPPSDFAPTRSSASDSSDDQSYDKLGDCPSSPHPDMSTAFEQSMASSFLISADMAHSVNPNYAGKYEPEHRPEMNKGPVIKINANAKYTTNSPGIALIQEIAKSAVSTDAVAESTGGVPLQLFVIRNDSLCGSTIGPMISAKLGVRALDLGNPQLAMHSIRETCGREDIGYEIRLFSEFFKRYGSLEAKIFVE